jgi:hypothetical protein
MNQDASRLRQLIHNCEQRKSLLIRQILQARRLIKGTIISMSRKCGKAGCKCERGEPHKSKCLSFSDGGKTRIIYLKGSDEIKVSDAVKRYQGFRKARAELVKLNTRVMDLLNKLEESQKEEVHGKQKEKKSVKSKKREKKKKERN